MVRAAVHALIAIAAYAPFAIGVSFFLRKRGRKLQNMETRTSGTVLAAGAVANLCILAVVLLLLWLLDGKSFAALGVAFRSTDLLFSVSFTAATFLLAIGFLGLLKVAGRRQIHSRNPVKAAGGWRELAVGSRINAHFRDGPLSDKPCRSGPGARLGCRGDDAGARLHDERLDLGLDPSALCDGSHQRTGVQHHGAAVALCGESGAFIAGAVRFQDDPGTCRAGHGRGLVRTTVFASFKHVTREARSRDGNAILFTNS
jgi:hypothetical protein